MSIGGLIIPALLIVLGIYALTFGLWHSGGLSVDNSCIGITLLVMGFVAYFICTRLDPLPFVPFNVYLLDSSDPATSGKITGIGIRLILTVIAFLAVNGFAVNIKNGVQAYNVTFLIIAVVVLIALILSIYMYVSDVTTAEMINFVKQLFQPN